jgi:iron only hydrogenase large subunit-like protein
VSAAVKAHLPADVDCRPELVQGLHRKGMKTLAAYASGTAPQGNLLEIMACEGGCIGGPLVITHPKVASAQLKKLE